MTYEVRGDKTGGVFTPLLSARKKRVLRDDGNVKFVFLNFTYIVFRSRRNVYIVFKYNPSTKKIFVIIRLGCTL